MQPARIHCTINGKMSQNTMEDYHYLAEGNAYRSDPKIIHKEATIKMLLVLSGDKNVNCLTSIRDEEFQKRKQKNR